MPVNSKVPDQRTLVGDFYYRCLILSVTSLAVIISTFLHLLLQYVKIML